MFLGFCAWKPNFCTQKLWKKFTVFRWKFHHFGCTNTVFRCKNPMFQVQFLHVLGAKMTCFECNFWTVWVQINWLFLSLNSLKLQLQAYLTNQESKICTQTRTKLHSKHVIFAPKTCKNCTWNLGFLHLKTFFFAPKNSEMFTIFRWKFHNFRCKNKDFRCKNTQKPGAKTVKCLHYICTSQVQKP